MIAIDPVRFTKGIVLGIVVTFCVCAIFSESFVIDGYVLLKMVVGGLVGALLRGVFRL